MRIILCDDDIRELSTLKTKLRHHLDEKKMSYQLIAYNSSEELMFQLEDIEKADLYILDIDMPGITGIDIAKKLKTMSPHIMLFFYTSHSEYATEGYRLEARRYILKGESDEHLYEAIDFACEKYAKMKKDCVSIGATHQMVNVPVDDIIYVRREKRQLTIVTENDGILRDARGIHELHDLLKRETFIFTDKGTFINIDQVYKLEQNAVIMFDKNVIYISRRKEAIVKERIARYWREDLE